MAGRQCVANASARQCEECGTGINGQARKRFCSNSCQKRSTHRRGIRAIRVCEGCGTQFQPKRTDRTRFCSRECAFKSQRLNGQLWSEKPHNGRRDPSCKVYFPACKTCGAHFTTRKPESFYCSAVCRQAIARTWAKEAHCIECGAPFSGAHGRRKVCSIKCLYRRQRALAQGSEAGREKIKAIRKARKLRLRAAVVESVSSKVVFDRDRWRCQLCGVRTPPRLRGTFEPRAPEVDHIIPIAKGGEHSYKNTQCACRSCNIAKGASEKGQLRLF